MLRCSIVGEADMRQRCSSPTVHGCNVGRSLFTTSEDATTKRRRQCFEPMLLCCIVGEIFYFADVATALHRQIQPFDQYLKSTPSATTAFLLRETMHRSESSAEHPPVHSQYATSVYLYVNVESISPFQTVGTTHSCNRAAIISALSCADILQGLRDLLPSSPNTSRYRSCKANQVCLRIKMCTALFHAQSIELPPPLA